MALSRERLVGLLHNRGIDQKEICRRAGISESNFSRYLNGHSATMRTSTLKKLAAALDMPYESFIDEIDDNAEPKGTVFKTIPRTILEKDYIISEVVSVEVSALLPQTNIAEAVKTTFTIFPTPITWLHNYYCEDIVWLQIKKDIGHESGLIDGTYLLIDSKNPANIGNIVLAEYDNKIYYGVLVKKEGTDPFEIIYLNNNGSTSLPKFETTLYKVFARLNLH